LALDNSIHGPIKARKKITIKKQERFCMVIILIG
jgi:hypothetical protein